MVVRKVHVAEDNVAERVWKSFPEGQGEIPVEGYGEPDSDESNMDVVADIADFANGVASLVVGHRHILVEGGFDAGLADVMCQALHAKLLGLDIWDSNGVVEWPDFEDEDEEED